MTSGLISVLGPTASGKSSVAMELAEELTGEIISCDSMQIYRGLDIGSAKPTLAERAAIPHHLVDFLDLTKPYSARRFQSGDIPVMRFDLSASWPKERLYDFAENVLQRRLERL